MRLIDRSFLRYLVTVVAVLTTVGFGHGRANAQSADATPGLDQVTCPAATRTIESMATLFADATPESNGVAESESVTFPVGDPASAEIVAEVSVTLHQAVACQNEGNLLGFLSLLTDHTITSTFPWFAEYLEDEEAGAELLNQGPLPPDLQQTLLAVGGVTVLEDGRYMAVMILDDPADEREGASALILTFIQTDSGLLVDEIGSLDRQGED